MVVRKKPEGMALGVFDLFSKRQKRARGEMPDVYVYDELPHPLRVQIVHIISDAFGEDEAFGGNNHALSAYEFVKQALCREFGVFELVKYPKSNQDSVFNFFLQEESAERALDVVELCFRFIQAISEDRQYLYYTKRKIEPDGAIAELNVRFKEHGVGYQFESGEIIRVDSQFLHAEAVKPTLNVLRDKSFKGANEEFLKAHEHYRHGRYKESLVDSLKAFESTMKTICSLRGWPMQPTDTAKNLISICMSNGLFPSYFESQFSSMRSLLESGVPTVRNKNGGHGQGAAPVAVPEYLARYTLNLTATTILFMVEAHQATK
ncbi:STM4504/CBY_0614 family protein [Variovorax sp. LT1R16]|uniref:STM4504/CBY_0614 family protein n=1 Tax=Variovorax sp. LT1R16 TaxID=3443728 RepID=UPI003F480796